MSKSGWKDLTRRYYAATGLVHDREQLKGRHRQLEQQWDFCNKLRYGSGLGRGSDGAVVADDDLWNKETKVHGPSAY